jgi:hypothetical protein
MRRRRSFITTSGITTLQLGGTPRVIRLDSGGGINTYSYSLSQPCRKTDRRGLWSGADGALLGHFLSRQGGYVDVSYWCNDYLNDSLIRSRTQLLKMKVDVKLYEYSGLRGSASFSIKQGGSAYITGIYSFADGNVRTETVDCEVEGDGCCVRANCKIRYYAYDRFDDPADFCQTYGLCGGVRNLIGKPFDFGISCSDSYSSSKCKK